MALIFPNTTVTHLAMEESYHVIILIETAKKEACGSQPFRFLHAWTTDNSKFDVVNAVWSGQERGSGWETFKTHRRLREIATTFKR